MPRVSAMYVKVEVSEKLIAALKALDIAFREVDKAMTRFNATRREGESLTDWGNRLDRAGLFDNPEIRWEYQKEVWRSMWRFISTPARWISEKLASMMENSF